MINMYWKYAGTQYKSKFSAIQAAGRDVENISFHTFDESVFNYNYTNEPTESLEELIKERCLEIRDNYSYIKFFFSGGSDSTTVLNSFLKNNIHIDEIVIYRFSTNNDFLNESNLEANEYAIPFVKNLDIKLTVHDWGAEYLSDLINVDKWFEKRNTLALRELTVANIRGKNFCNLFASPEPRIEKVDGSWQLFAYDTDIYEEHLKFRNIEHFFYTPKLMAKQAHILKNFCNLHKEEPSKAIIRNVLRDPAVAEIQLKQQGGNSSVDPLFDNPKEKLMLKDSDTHFKDKYRYLLSTKVDNIPVIRMLRGYELFRFNLGT